jgi:RNA polymerase sigma-70 factor (ECF subfamily)
MVSMGDERQLDELLIEGYGRAYRTAYLIMRNPAAAEEAVQEAFLRVWRFRDSLPDGDGVDPWIYRVLVNTCYSELRKVVPERERTVHGFELDELAERSSGPEERATRSSTAEVVLDALGTLPEQLRVPAVLRYWTGLSEKEIAIAIRRRPGTVKSRLHEARRRLAADPRIAALAPDADTDADEVAR